MISRCLRVVRSHTVLALAIFVVLGMLLTSLLHAAEIQTKNSYPYVTPALQAHPQALIGSGSFGDYSAGLALGGGHAPVRYWVLPGGMLSSFHGGRYNLHLLQRDDSVEEVVGLRLSVSYERGPANRFHVYDDSWMADGGYLPEGAMLQMSIGGHW